MTESGSKDVLLELPGVRATLAWQDKLIVFFLLRPQQVVS